MSYVICYDNTKKTYFKRADPRGPVFGEKADAQKFDTEEAAQEARSAFPAHVAMCCDIIPIKVKP